MCAHIAWLKPSLELVCSLSRVCERANNDRLLLRRLVRRSAAMATAYTGEKNHENGNLPEDQDDPDYVRAKFVIHECPLAHECADSNKNIFKGANVWSYESEVKCRNYLAHHLHCSGKHQHTKEGAMQLALGAQVDMEQEVFSERQEYRDWLSKQGSTAEAPSNKRRRRGGAANEQGQNWAGLAQGGDWYQPPQLDVDSIAAAVAHKLQEPAAPAVGDDQARASAVIAPAVQPGFSLADGVLALKRAPKVDGHVQVPIERARLIMDCLERADLAIQSFVTSAVEAAQRARSAQSVIDENRLTLGSALRQGR